MLKRFFLMTVVVVMILGLSASFFAQNKSKATTSKSKVRPKVKRVNMEDGVFLPGYRTTNKRNKTARKTRSFSSTTQPFADGLVLEKRKNRNSRTKVKSPKGSHNLLPYIEQNNRNKPKSKNKN